MEAEPARGVESAIVVTDEPRRRSRNVAALSVLMVAVWTTGSFALLLALTAFGLQCDESCVSPPRADTAWYERPDASQWTEQLMLAGVGFLGIAAATYFIVARRRRMLGLVSLGVAVVCYAAWAVRMSESFWL
jgi:hypothetical protein